MRGLRLQGPLNRNPSVLLGSESYYKLFPRARQSGFRASQTAQPSKIKMALLWKAFSTFPHRRSPPPSIPLPAAICPASSHGLSLEVIRPRAFVRATPCSHPPRGLPCLPTTPCFLLSAKWIPIKSTVLQLGFGENLSCSVFRESQALAPYLFSFPPFSTNLSWNRLLREGECLFPATRYSWALFFLLPFFFFNVCTIC